MMTYMIIIVGGIGISAVAIKIIFSLGQRSGRVEQEKDHAIKVAENYEHISQAHQNIDKAEDKNLKNQVKGPWLRNNWPTDY